MTRALTVAEVAAEMRVSPTTVRRAIRAGEIPSLRVGRTIRVSRVWLDAHLSASSPAVQPARAAGDAPTQ